MSGRGAPAPPPQGSRTRAQRWAVRAPCLVGFLLGLVDGNMQTKMRSASLCQAAGELPEGPHSVANVLSLL